MATNPLAPLHPKRRFSGALYARPAPALEPDEHGPGSAEDWRVTAPVRPDTAHVRAPRFLDLTGDFVSAVLIIAGGVFAYGFVQIG
ncbi:hypothetical protein MKK58_09410 [Methylobacterium sp. J-078]|uniref:hypothetical protein n=1 Tax=Methylobacterium sp. J-078 TaxID=2836657 RepID=UPI001FB95380|nr:hypothetical protein [Methylobacterium sp. J-078]MCJ2044743.1 hypothetical protein [Methylobacterium sp. J-078]